MRAGSLVPDAMILRLITGELKSRGCLQPPSSSAETVAFSSSSSASASEGDAANSGPLASSNDPSASYILDGFPRTAAQAASLDTLVPINMVVHIDTPISVILERIVNRWVHAPSGRVYNTTFNPPKISGKDDITGETLTRREDDSEEVWKARLGQFEEMSGPLLEHYDRKGVLWRVEGNTSNEISPKLFDEFGKRFGGNPAIEGRDVEDLSIPPAAVAAGVPS